MIDSYYIDYTKCFQGVAKETSGIKWVKGRHLKSFENNLQARIFRCQILGKH